MDLYTNYIRHRFSLNSSNGLLSSSFHCSNYVHGHHVSCPGLVWRPFYWCGVLFFFHFLFQVRIFRTSEVSDRSLPSTFHSGSSHKHSNNNPAAISFAADNMKKYPQTKSKTEAEESWANAETHTRPHPGPDWWIEGLHNPCARLHYLLSHI